MLQQKRAVSSVVKTLLSDALGSNPGSVKSDSVVNGSQALRRFCAARALSRANRSRNSLNAST